MALASRALPKFCDSPLTLLGEGQGAGARQRQRGWAGLFPAAALLGALAIPHAALAQLPAPAPVVQPAQESTPQPAVDPGAQPAATPSVPAAVTQPVAAVSRLPAEMSLRELPGVLLLLANNSATGQTVVVAQLELPGPKFDTICVGGFLYVARWDAEVVVLDVHDRMQPRRVASFKPGGPVTALWGGNGSLLVTRRDGSMLMFDVRDPGQPRYQGIMAGGAAPVAGLLPAGGSAPMAGVLPAAGPVPVADAMPGAVAPEPDSLPFGHDRKDFGRDQSRVAFAMRPFLFFANHSRSPTSSGAVLDLSYQYAKLYGLWWGIELSPFVLNSYNGGAPTANTRVWFGYAGRSYGLGLAMGSGVTDTQAFFQLGPVLRFGRLDGVHSMIRLMWQALLPVAYPTSGEFTLEGPITKRIGLRYNFTGDSALNGIHTTLGLQIFVGGDRRWRTTVLTAGAGFAFMRTNSSQGLGPDTNHPGVIFSFAVEPRW